MALSLLHSPPPPPTPTASHVAPSPYPLPLLLRFRSDLSHSQTGPFFQNNYSLTSVSASNKWRTRISFFPAFLNRRKSAQEIKEELLEAIKPLDRGAEATPEDQQRIEQIARKLEAVNPTKQPVKSKLIDGKWELLYTTSRSISEAQRPKFLRSFKLYQGINVDTLRAQNMETWPFFNQVTADLTPVNSRKVAVKFDYFKVLGLIPIKASERFRGSLETTYLDEELRISRGDLGNLFVLKMVDPSYRVPL